MFAGLIAVVSLVASMHTASIPAPDGTIDGCYSNITHALFVEDSNGSCPLLTTPLSWNQTGPQGPAGPQGVQGPQGPSGETYTFTSVQAAQSSPIAPGATSATATVDCPGDDIGPGGPTPGIIATGGGFYFSSGLISGGQVSQSWPPDDVSVTFDDNSYNNYNDAGVSHVPNDTESWTVSVNFAPYDPGAEGADITPPEVLVVTAICTAPSS
jgi:hypothetical protein